MNIAIINLRAQDDIKSNLDLLQLIDDEVIGAKIDLFIDEDLQDMVIPPYIYRIIPLRLKQLGIQDLSLFYKNIRYYAFIGKYDIAIDLGGSWSSPMITYLLAGKTAGFTQKGIKRIVTKLYDDHYIPKDNEDTRIIQKNLFAKTFGFENQ